MPIELKPLFKKIVIEKTYQENIYTELESAL
jgi:hypothetical protein